jgi:hypothetical protein
MDDHHFGDIRLTPPKKAILLFDVFFFGGEFCAVAKVPMIHMKIYPNLATNYVWKYNLKMLFLYFWLHTWTL